MHRCIELARLGAGYVAPNPMVGALLVHNGAIIGEGYHQQYGQAHAEVNCVESVRHADKSRIPSATMYVTLEPCSHFGKTPPCTDLIIREKIPAVVIGSRDPFPLVNGSGIEKLREHGISVTEGVAETQCAEMNRRFFCFHRKKRPYIILKWAQTANQKIAHADRSRLYITNEHTNRLVHKWRAEEAAIMVGTNTVLSDNPSLTNRLWKGPDPVRIMIDMDLRIPATRNIFSGHTPLIIFNRHRQEKKNGVLYQKISDARALLEITDALYSMNISSVIIEGGAALLSSFIEAGLWDEARVITNTSQFIENGLQSPSLTHAALKSREVIGDDLIHFYTNIKPDA